MGKFDVETIIGHVADNPLLEPNKYEVVITGPVKINRHMAFNCSQAAIPGHNVGTFEHSVMGPKRKMPNEELFDDLTLTFYNGHHLYEIGAIHDWIKLISGGDTYRMAYYNDIVADINITIYDLKEHKVGEVKFAEAYPVGFGDVDLSYAGESPSTVTVNFTYHSYEFERVVTDRQSTAAVDRRQFGL